MKVTTALLFPAAVFSTAFAWGRSEPAKMAHSEEAVPAASRRHDYKQSLKKPFIYQDNIPFWERFGNSFVSNEFIRLAPSVPGLKGSLWRSTPNTHKEWEVEFSFKAFGQGSVGGKGIAFWYTKDRTTTDGPVFGLQDKWTGLGIFLDSSDPANQRSSSVIYGIMNDGTKPFPSDPTAHANSFGGCLRDYKNTANPVYVHVSYIGNTLKVSTDTHAKGKKYLTCFEQKDIELPSDYYFGFSAAASEVSSPDDHDLYSMEFYEANPPAKVKAPLRPHEQEMKSRGEEIVIDESDRKAFEDVQSIVGNTEAKLRENDVQETLTPAQIVATIGDTQARIIDSLNNLHNKFESIGAPVQAPESTAHSINELNAKMNKVIASLQAMETLVESMVTHIVKQGGGDISDITKVFKEEIQNLNYKMEDLDSKQTLNHRVMQSRLAHSSSWMSYVVYLIIFQIIAFFVFTWYKKRLEYNEKKFL